MNIIKTFPRSYGVAAYVLGRAEDIKKLRLPEPKLIPHSHLPGDGLAYRRIGGFRNESEVAEWCKAHGYWMP